MNPPPPKGTNIKHTAIGTMKGQGKGQSSRSSPSKRFREGSSSVPPQPKRPRSAASTVASQNPLFRNSLQKKRYELIQGTKYSCGRQILWNVFAFANFYTELHDYFVKMSWMGLANLSEKFFCPLLVNEFYSGLLMHADEYDNPVHFKSENLYTFIDGEERVIKESDLGKLLGCEFYTGPSEMPNPFPVESIWDNLAREPGCKKVASNLKSLPLRFLHHFIASTIQCRTGSFAKVTGEDVWLLHMATTGTKINLVGFIIKKMLKILNEKEKEASSKTKKTPQSLFALPYVTLITHYARTKKILQPKYDLVQIAVVYNLASIAKMGYKDPDNNGNFIKMRGEEGEEDEPVQAPETHTLGKVMDVLADIQISLGNLNTRFDHMEGRLDSLGAQVADIRRLVDLGASADEIHGDPVRSPSSEATHSQPPHA